MKSTRKLIYAALMTGIIVICSWISIPSVVPFTLQTFAVFCALGFLGWGCGGLAVAAYILLGAFGLPVFSGFVGGVYSDLPAVIYGVFSYPQHSTV